MTFRSGANFDNTRARRGGGRRGAVAAGGGIGTLVFVGLFLLLGGNPDQLGSILGSGDGVYSDQGQLGGGEGTSGDFSHCQTAEDGNTNDECRVLFTVNSVDAVWEKVLPEQAGIDYTQAGAVIFQNSTNSGCSFASAATGPFYCPADQSAYFDVSFFEQLGSFGGTNAPLAQMYIVAHEFGHHIQQLEGTLGLSNYNDPGADSNAVKIELQADCYAGLWAHHADDGEDAFLEPISDEEVRAAVDTARAVGDDNIQRRSAGEVRPDLWTHGSSQQRADAFITGYREGTMSACDTLDRGVYSS